MASLGDRLILAAGICALLGLLMSVLVVFSKKPGYGTVSLLERVAIVAAGLIAVIGLIGTFGEMYFIVSYVVLAVAYVIVRRLNRIDSPT